MKFTNTHSHTHTHTLSLTHLFIHARTLQTSANITSIAITSTVLTLPLQHGDGSSGGELALNQSATPKVLGEGGAIVDAREEEEEEEWVTDDGR